ncbi:MAG TPA: hypothetical protein VFY23_04585 [Candidatus Limnocylindrales bacterium]|nr:hypothetical protein [Candidatus Limnocylindrales bacterium]
MTGLRARTRAERARAGVGAIAIAVAMAVVACGPLAAEPGGTESAPSGTTPLVGAWVTDVTRDDLRAGGITEEGLLDENSGRFTWTFLADGTWTQVQESLDGAAIGAPVFEGLWEVDGDELIAQTTSPEAYAGDRLVFAWRLSDGKLSLDLTNPPDMILPIVMEAHPWEPATP